MPCKHKFFNDLLLPIDFEPETLIIGTFNPEWPEENTAEWFYGRTNNNHLWSVLPRIYKEKPLDKGTPKEWKAFCKRNRVAFTDLISAINDADNSNTMHQTALKEYKDTEIIKNFKEIETTDIIGILKRYDTIRNVYFTRQLGVPMFDQHWNSVKKYCKEHNLHCKELLTPSGNARFQIKNWKSVNPERDLKPALKDFLFDWWISKWHLLQ